MALLSVAASPGRPPCPRTRNNCTPMAKGPAITRHDSSSMPSSCLRWDMVGHFKATTGSISHLDIRNVLIASSNNVLLGCGYANMRDPAAFNTILSGWEGNQEELLEATSQFQGFRSHTSWIECEIQPDQKHHWKIQPNLAKTQQIAISPADRR